jgi:hypothetical protein
MNKFILLIFIGGLPIVFSGCCSHRNIVSDIKHSDSTRVEIRKEIITVPDTVYIEIPAQKAERTTTEKESNLENDYAMSEAHINYDGTLYHNLTTKQQMKAVETKKTIEKNDSIIYRTIYKDNVITKEVEKKLSWWEKTQIYGFWAAVILLIIIYRKNIYSFVKLFF